MLRPPRLTPRSDAESLWEGEVGPSNVEHIRLRLEDMLDGRAFTMTRAFEYNGWELEMFPICRFRETGDDAGVYVHRGHVEFAAADWHWVIPEGATMRLERDRASWHHRTPEGKAYRVALVRLEDERDFNVVLAPEAAALVCKTMRTTPFPPGYLEAQVSPLVEHIDRVFPGNERWLRRWDDDNRERTDHGG